MKELQSTRSIWLSILRLLTQTWSISKGFSSQRCVNSALKFPETLLSINLPLGCICSYWTEFRQGVIKLLRSCTSEMRNNRISDLGIFFHHSPKSRGKGAANIWSKVLRMTRNMYSVMSMDPAGLLTFIKHMHQTRSLPLKNLRVENFPLLYSLTLLTHSVFLSYDLQNSIQL